MFIILPTHHTDWLHELHHQ